LVTSGAIRRPLLNTSAAALPIPIPTRAPLQHLAMLRLLAFVGAGIALAAPAAEQEACLADAGGGASHCEAADVTLEEQDDPQSLVLLQRRAQEQVADVDLAGDVVGDMRAATSRRRRGGGGGQAAGSTAPAPAASSDDGPTPTAAELKTLAAVVGRLWQLDAPYRLEPGKGFQLNMQSAAASLSSGRDTSSGALFKSVDQTKLTSAPCASNFLALLDNYERDTSKAERNTAQERSEENAFVSCLMKTPHMKYVYNVLVKWGTIKADYAAFATQVSTIWFTAYSLSSRGPMASSGFEHTFVGEEKYDRRTKESKIIGLHNWLQFWREEKAGNIDYLGYVGKQGNSLVSVRFSWQDDDPDLEKKSVSTFLVGSSPAFEMAMLTCAFLGFNGEAKVPGLYFGREGPLELVAYSWKSKGQTLVRTAYLEQ